VDSKAIKNYISIKAIKRLRLSYKQKKNLYPLVTISEDPILYRDRIIHLKTGPVKLEIKGKNVVTSFNILPLKKNKAVLGIPFLREYNPKINWVTGDIEIQDTQRHRIQQQTKLIWYQVRATYEEAKA